MTRTRDIFVQNSEDRWRGGVRGGAWSIYPSELLGRATYNAAFSIHVISCARIICIEEKKGRSRDPWSRQFGVYAERNKVPNLSICEWLLVMLSHAYKIYHVFLITLRYISLSFFQAELDPLGLPIPPRNPCQSIESAKNNIYSVDVWLLGTIRHRYPGPWHGTLTRFW